MREREGVRGQEREASSSRLFKPLALRFSVQRTHLSLKQRASLLSLAARLSQIPARLSCSRHTRVLLASCSPRALASCSPRARLALASLALTSRSPHACLSSRSPRPPWRSPPLCSPHSRLAPRSRRACLVLASCLPHARLMLAFCSRVTSCSCHAHVMLASCSHPSRVVLAPCSPRARLVLASHSPRTRLTLSPRTRLHSPRNSHLPRTRPSYTGTRLASRSCSHLSPHACFII